MVTRKSLSKCHSGQCELFCKVTKILTARLAKFRWKLYLKERRPPPTPAPAGVAFVCALRCAASFSISCMRRCKRLSFCRAVALTRHQPQQFVGLHAQGAGDASQVRSRRMLALALIVGQ